MTFKPKTYIDEEGRVCTRCNEFKLWSEFYRKKKGHNGYTSKCKICATKQVMECYYDNREERLKYMKNYHKSNKEKISEDRKKYYQSNKEKILEDSKKYRESQRDNPVHVLTKRYWAMIYRCYNPDQINYPMYGGRGITVCRDWRGEKGKENFIKWALANGFKPELEIDRIDNNKGYSPENCRWVTDKKNSNNRRDNIYLFQGDKRFTLAEFAERLNVPYSTVYSGYQRELAEEDHKGGYM